jgi:ATP synthase protein I
MSDTNPKGRPKQWENHIAEKEARKIRARRRKDRSIFFGFGAFGMVGWSVVVPTLLGIFIGIWIDHNWPSRFSWTLMLFMSGLAIGCYNAWRWLYFESGLIRHEDEDDIDRGNE